MFPVIAIPSLLILCCIAMFVTRILRQRVDARFGITCRGGFLYYNDGERTAELSYKIDCSREGLVALISFEGASWTMPRFAYAPVTKVEQQAMEELLKAWAVARGYVDVIFETDKQADESRFRAA